MYCRDGCGKTFLALTQSVCICLVLLFASLCCVPRLHHPVRQVLRPLVVHHVEAGLAWVEWAQGYEAPWLTAVFERSSHSVSVGFYGSFLPALFWLGLPELGTNLVFLMAATLFVGNAIKDLVSAPRPLSLEYGVEKLRFLTGSSEEAEKNAKEYGCPSSHTMNTLCLNFYVVHYCVDKGILQPGPAALLYLGVALWVVWIAASRVYLGLHTPIDLLSGAVAGMAVLVCFIMVEDHVQAWLHESRWVVPQAALLSLVLLRLHPRPMSHTPSYEFTVSFVGVFFGVASGMSQSRALHEPAVQYHAVLALGPLWCGRRLLIGLLAVMAVKELCKRALQTALPLLYLLFPLRLRRTWQPPIHNQHPAALLKGPLRGLPHDESGRPWDVAVTARFFSYAGIGFGVAELVPALFAALGW